ncbi:hypothetical protein N9C31_01865 [Gammaproteobacteria bacterium]|nr:hypothetical protein [Gammaproteobacteria bacterium]
MLAWALHFLIGVAVFGGYYYLSIQPPLIHMEFFLLNQIYVFDVMSLYMILVGLLIAIYLVTRLVLYGLVFFQKAGYYQQAYHQVVSDKLVRQAIEAWVVGKTDKAIKKFSKSMDMRGNDPLYDLFLAWLLSTGGQMQLSDAKLLDLLNRRYLSHEVAAGIRAKLYWHQGQPSVAVSILRQQLKHYPSRGLLLLLYQILNESMHELSVQYVEIVEQTLNHWRLIKDDKQFRQALYQAIDLSIERGDGHFYHLWPYGKAALGKEQVIFLDYKHQFSQDDQKGVDYLIQNLQNIFYASLYQELGLVAYRVDEQIQLANRWLSRMDHASGVKIMSRLYFASGDHHQGLEMAKTYLSLNHSGRL